MVSYKKYFNENTLITKLLKENTQDVMCLDDKKMFRDKTYIGTVSENADILSLLLCVKKRKCKNIVAKIVPLTYKDIKNLVTKNETYYTTKFTEILMMKLVNKLVESKMTPNLPLMYSNSLCLYNCSFKNKNFTNVRDYIGCLLQKQIMTLKII
jgi:hypothetical protein